MSTTPKISSKELIHRAGSERALIGICLNKPDQLILASGSGLKPEHFAVDAHKYIYMAMSYLIENGNNPDPISITQVFTDDKANKAIEEMGGVTYIESMRLTPSVSNTQMHIDNVKLAAACRDVYDKSKKIMDRMIKGTESDVNTVLSAVESDFRDISIEYQVATGVTKLGENTADRLKQRLLTPQDVIGLKTGWKLFDLATLGLIDGELTIVGARSKVGKSTVLLNWCNKICIEDGVPTLYIDTEMYDYEQEDKLLSIISRVPHEEIRTGRFGVDTEAGKAIDKIAALQDANRELKEAPFFHVYLPNFTPEKIKSLVRKYQVEHSVKLVVFDYIKLPSSDSSLGDKEHQALGYLTSSLKDIAGELKVPIISAVQLNRSAVGKEDMDEGMIAGSDRILFLANRVCMMRKSTEEEYAITGCSRQFKIMAQRMGQELDWTPIKADSKNWRMEMI
ncbi:replicative DNA helicase [Bacillus toyonensis]|uniref:replicative DNA helicase n=1 Tax=Bacillus toyonensis TaxID=155322 RepID=UPI0020D2783C|nr:DnaB-like helicase C-terminal domain-containing protein [Bacillus toyonensis]